MNLPEVFFEKFDERATIPKRATEYSAGFDLYAMENCMLYSHSPALIDTGIVVAIPIGWCGMIWPRSGKSIEYSCDILAGLIDADYRKHTMKVALFNQSNMPWRIEAGDRIAQITFVPHLSKGIEVPRGTIQDLGTRTGGFGSTGTK